jgi:hypothetical protein
MHPSIRISLELCSEWIEEKVDPETQVMHNPREYAIFTSATALFESDDVVSVEDVANPREDGRFITKTTIGRLYREITDIHNSYNSVIEESTPELIIEQKDIEEAILDHNVSDYTNPSEVETWISRSFDTDFIDIYARRYTEINLANRVLPFFVLSQVIIEDYSINLLIDNLIDEGFQDSNTTKRKLENNFRQPGREILLQRTGIISGDFRSKMEEVRKTRNNLTHNLRGSDYFDDVFDSIEQVDKAIRIVSDFEDRYNESILSPLPESS